MILPLAALLAVTPIFKPTIEWQPPDSTDAGMVTNWGTDATCGLLLVTRKI